MSDNQTLDMTHGNPVSLLIRFALPLVLGSLFQQLYNFVDTAVVGQCISVEALSAVGVTNALNYLILGFTMQGPVSLVCRWVLSIRFAPLAMWSFKTLSIHWVLLLPRHRSAARRSAQLPPCLWKLWVWQWRPMPVRITERIGWTASGVVSVARLPFRRSTLFFREQY